KHCLHRLLAVFGLCPSDGQRRHPYCPQRPLQADPFRIGRQEIFWFGQSHGPDAAINGKDTAYVTGVMKDMPFNSHFRVDMLVSLSTLTRAWNPGTEQNWGRSGFYTYVLLSQPSDAARLAAQLPAFVDRHY